MKSAGSTPATISDGSFTAFRREDAPRARFDSLSYSLLAPGADAMSAAHETHLTRLWDHLGSWFAIEDRV